MKQKLIKYLQELLQGQVQEKESDLASLKKSRDTNDKSTAGDKHEVGRAMAQIELDNLETQLQRNLSLKKELETIELERSNEEIGKGSLVFSDNGLYFISIGMGAVQVEGQEVFVISPSSPIGQLLMAKKVGEVVEFNGRTISIKEIQ